MAAQSRVLDVADARGASLCRPLQRIGNAPLWRIADNQHAVVLAYGQTFDTRGRGPVQRSNFDHAFRVCFASGVTSRQCTYRRGLAG